MESYIDLENLLVRYDNITVRVVIQDFVNEPWFNAKHVCTLLGYVNHRDTLKMHVSKENKKQLHHLVSNFKALYKNVQGNSYFINDKGFNELILKSNKPKAKEIQKWIANKVIPTFRKDIMNGFNEYLKKEVVELDKKYDKLKKDVKEKNKRIMQLENNQKPKKFLKHSAVYIIRPSITSDKKMNKIGSCKDASKRFAQYNTTVPDDIHIVDVFYVKYYKQVEQCAKALLHKYIYRTGRGNGKEYYKCSRNQIWEMLNVCVSQIEGKHLSEIKKELRGMNRQTVDDDKVEIYEFDSNKFSVANTQKGGSVDELLDGQTGGSNDALLGISKVLSDEEVKRKALKYIAKISALIEKMGGLDDIVL